MEDSLHFCYLDESGMDPASSVLVVAGFIAPAGGVARMTREFIAAKRKFFPEKFQNPAKPDDIRKEIKGRPDLVKMLREGDSDQKRRAGGFLVSLLCLLNRRLGARLVGRVHIKGPKFDMHASYEFSMRVVAENFQHFLENRQAQGIIVCDSRRRSPHKCQKCGVNVVLSDKMSARPNVSVSHAFFVEKFARECDSYPRIPESPTFVDSQNHAGIQIADLLCSAVIAPLATAIYCPNSSQTDKWPLALRERYGEQMELMLFPYRDEYGFRRRGLGVTSLQKHSSRLLFRP